MNIVADENLALTDYFFAEFGKIRHVPGRHLQQQDLEDADAEVLLVRSVTQVNAELIANTALSFVGSATIGTDHLDQHALAAAQIDWANAPGCNAQAVAEYVVTAILTLKASLFLDADPTTGMTKNHSSESVQPFCLGIVGLGNVGSRLAKLAQHLGWQVLAYDPYVDDAEISQHDLASVLQHADAVSIHVPLTRSGADATWHLFNAETLAQMKPEAILINAARGAVVEEAALIADIQRTGRDVVLDVFEHEPVISAQLLDLVKLATPHIAGYSLEGKARGTQMLYDAFCATLGMPATKDFRTQLPEAASYFDTRPMLQVLGQHLKQIYDIQKDDAELRACLKQGVVDQAAFDALRKHYPLRREWAAHGAPQQ